jgi:hypothetical protein
MLGERWALGIAGTSPPLLPGSALYPAGGPNPVAPPYLPEGSCAPSRALTRSRSPPVASR